jgi:membrane-associated phospholipid phosphatase
MTFLVWRPAAPWLAVATAGLALGAVYGGFHYGVDVLSGLLYGLTLFAIAPLLARRWGGGPPGAAHDEAARG